ncbi:MAG TPA: isoprenylcysteine carboxylmethyltransferase family protein [Steroidobacteraceae bacterium]|jgi:protein-S-isoprenylcysteine O-methyltransferase Ste14
MKRIVIFVYGVLCYALSLVAFVYAVGFIGGFLAPTLLDAAPNRPLAQALGIDLALLAVFALQHSGMARPAFKRWWTRIVPEAAERSTYVLLSSLAVGAFFAFWQPVGGVIWQSEGTTRALIIGVYLFGWALLFYTTFLIDHFDLLGLKQVWRQLIGREYRPPQFYTPSLYRVVRHPLYIGWLTIFWAAPTMTVSHLLFALATTAYILVAIRFEERDLVDAFGDAYLAYRRRTPMLVPNVPALGRTPAAAKNEAPT